MKRKYFESVSPQNTVVARTGLQKKKTISKPDSLGNALTSNTQSQGTGTELLAAVLLGDALFLACFVKSAKSEMAGSDVEDHQAISHSDADQLHCKEIL